MGNAKKGSEYVCDVCGTTLVVTECGTGYLEDIVCCSQPMKAGTAKTKKAKSKKSKAKKAVKRKK
jgi:hypothetical protein